MGPRRPGDEPRPGSNRPPDARGAVLASLVAIVIVATGVGVVSAPASSAQQQPDAARGEELYAAACAMCHGADATGMMGMHPALRGAVDRLTREGVEVTIRNGRATDPPMPAFGEQLSDDDIADLIAYIRTLPDGPRNFGPEAGMMAPGEMMDPDMMDRMMRGRRTGPWEVGWAWAAPALLLGLVVVVLVAATIVWAIRSPRRRTAAVDGGEPLDVLDMRYARGELSRDDYLQRRADVQGPG